MIRSIVTGFDGSDSARDALTLGQLLARISGAQLTAASVYVFHPIHREGDGEIERYVREAARERLETLDEVAGEPRARAVVVRGHSIPEGLQRCARERDADLLVVGSTHRGGVGRVLAGDVSERLLQGSDLPVAITPRGYAATTPPPALHTIGVGYDGSDEARAALDAAAEIARAAEAPLHVITAFNPHISGLTPRLIAELELADYLASGRQQLADRQAAAVAALRDAGIDASADGEQDDEASVLTARSHQLDLLVLGSRCYGPWRRLLLGSVSAKLVRQAACPLLLVPRSAMPPHSAAAGEASAQEQVS